MSKIYTGYEDGLICVWNHEGGMEAPLVGHVHRINALGAVADSVVVSCSNDCTVRKWDAEQHICITIIKFDSPISNAVYQSKNNMLHVCTWDKYIRAVDMASN